MPISYRPIVPRKIGLRRLHQLYGQFAQVMGDFATESHDELATYPPQKAETRYRRTGTLGRSWSHRVLLKSDKIETVVGSQGQIAPYNVYVQGAQQRKGMRGIGWKTPKEVLERLWPKIRKQIRAKLKGAAR